MEKTIHELFEEQVERTPDHIAGIGPSLGPVHHLHLQITYKELNEKSNRLCHYLNQRVINQNGLLGLLVKRSIEMIIGILGILKAGCGYVPLNPKAPATRNRYILEACGTKLVLTNCLLSGENGWKEWGVETVFLWGEGNDMDMDNYSPGLDVVANTRYLHSLQSTVDLAYVMFTSGSTGKPKGVAITHANISPLLHWGYKHMGLIPGDRTLQNLSYYFDWSVWEIFITLTSGASLCLIPEDVLLNSEDQLHIIRRNAITVLHITPTHFRALIGEAESTDLLYTLKYLAIGAEKLTYELVNRACEWVSEDCRLFNMYGPTEAAIMSAVLEIDRSGRERYKTLTSVPLGKAIANTALLVLNRYMKACPLKVMGELYIAGDGLANGYLNNVEKTVAVFVENIFAQEGIKGERLYKTGDLVRWLPDGNIEFLGRIDHQVKIRGFRIELGEIESQLLSYNGVKEAVVLTKETTNKCNDSKENRDKYLVAYVVLESGVSLSVLQLKDYLSKILPPYMVPSYFVMLDRIPLTANGKNDRRALPEPQPGEIGIDYVSPRNAVEKELVKIWSEVLSIDENKIGIDDNFFQLGGHSLNATTAAAKIHK
ncbi:amino acid adenylation domain-containing protein, partial [Acidobacteriota bacterium]